MNIRKSIPARRINPKPVSNYHQYKDDLREDFECRCGYCGDHDFFRVTDFQIDHFVPRTQMKTIKITDYSNLVYACRSCNRSKSNQWPTNNERIANNGKEGFIDPCDPAYDKQFSRNNRGEIVPITQLGEWMWFALSLGNPAHSVVWKLEQLLIEIKELQSTEDTFPADASIAIKLNGLYKDYLNYLDQLKEGAPVF